MTGVLHSVSSSPFRSPRYRLRSFPGCFGPSISTLMCMYFLFMHSQGGMFYMPTNTGQVLCVLLWLPKGFDSIGARDQHYVPWILPKVLLEVQCLPLGPISRVTQHPIFFWIIFFSFFLLLHPFRMPAHDLSLPRVREITLQTRNDRKVPHHFLRSFLLLVSTCA